MTFENSEIISSSKDKIYALILFFLVLVVYANSLPNQYSIDDDITIFKNAQIAKGIAGIPAIMTQPYTDAYHGSSYGYRPISAVTFAVEHQLWGFYPEISHGANVLIYAINVLLLLFFLRKFLYGYNFVFIYVGVLLFALHPIHTEVVNNLKSRDILLSLLFGLLTLSSLLSFLRENDNKTRKIVISSVLYTIACLAHPMALILAGVWLLIVLFEQPVKQLWKSKSILPLFSVVMLVILFKFVDFYTDYVSDGYKTDPNFLWENPLYVLHDTSKTAGLAFNALWFYAQKLLLPYPLAYYYGYNQIPYETWQQPMPLLSIALHVAILVGGIVLFFRRNLFGFLLLCYFVCIFPFSNLLQIGPGIVAERWAYFASIPFSLIISYCVFKLFNFGIYKEEEKRSIPMYAIIGALLAIYTIIVVQRNPDWYNTTTLAANDTPNLPNSAKANSFFAEEMMRDYLQEKEPNAQKHSAIEGLFLNALKIDSTYAEVWNNLGVMNFRKGDTTTAQICYEQALKYKQPYYLAMSNLADIYNKKGDFSTAIRLYADFIRQDSTELNAFLNLARFQSATQQLEQALQTNQTALRLFPQQSAIIYDNNAIVLYENNQKQKALDNWKLALQKDPQNKNIQLKINNINEELGFK